MYTLLENKFFKVLLFGIICFNFIIAQQERDCPENFSVNPQFPAIDPECYPDEFVYYSSVNLAYYLFNLVTINDMDISPEDWVGAFNGDVCVGARMWGACNASTCDVPVFGDDGSEFTDGYMTSQPGNNIPSFKIYDVSENIYIDATPSENIEWALFNSPIIDILYSYAEIQGCMDQYACNYNANANINDSSCEYCSCYLDPEIINTWDYTIGPSGNEVISNYNDYEFNGSITARVYADNQEIGSEGDIIAAFIDNELRGISFADSVPVQLGGGYVFNIMVFNNESNSSIINFIYYNNNNDALACLDETLEFTSDMIYGNALSPFIFDTSEDWLSIEIQPETFNINSAYPNPFNPLINIDYSILEPSEYKIYIYDIFGKLVDEIKLGYLSKGNYSSQWISDEKSSSIYFLVLSNGFEKHTKKISLIK